MPTTPPKRDSVSRLERIFDQAAGTLIAIIVALILFTLASQSQQEEIVVCPSTPNNMNL